MAALRSVRISGFLFVLLVIFAGSAQSQGCKEYFTNVWANPLDMSGPEDILYNIVPIESRQFNPHVYSGGIFSSNVNASLAAGPVEAWLQLLTPAVSGAIADDNSTRYGNRRPIDPAQYGVLKVRMNTDRASHLYLLWEKADGSIAVTEPVSTSTGFNTYTLDLRNIGLVTLEDPNPNNRLPRGPTARWNESPIVGLRLYPSRIDGALIQIDWIELTNDGCGPLKRFIAPFIKPDNEGGEDYFSTVRGNPSNFDSPKDIDFLSGTTDAFIHPGDVYTDSAGVQRSGDYFQAANKAGDRDPVNLSVFAETKRPIDPARFKLTCWTMDVLLPPTSLKTVARILWQRDGRVANGDDIIIRTNGETRYCARLDTLPLEPALPPGAAHPWARNPNGSGIDYWRIDVHEIDSATTYRLNDIRLAADHEADQRYAVVLGGDRDAAVSVFYSSGGTETELGSLPANRNTDVLIWDTSALPNGSYSLRSQINGNSFNAPAPVVVNHSTGIEDSTSPILNVLAPLEGHVFGDTLQIAGTALDNRRIAIVEALIDGKLVDSFLPDQFDKAARDANPSLPYNSTARFDRTVSTSGLSNGAHTFLIRVTDTAGNVVTHSGNMSKAASGLTPAVTFQAPAEALVPVPSGARARPRLDLRVRSEGSTINYTVSGVEECSNIRLLASATGPSAGRVRKKGLLLGTQSPGGRDTLLSRSSNVPKLRLKKGLPRTAGRIYVLADCGAGSPAKVRAIDATKLKGAGASKAIPVLIERMKSGFSG